jgi:maleylacetoacetate isomerase
MLKLYSYWRSSAAYRVRIALNLKVLDYDIAPVHLTQDGGQHHGNDYRALNPQELIPLLVDGDLRVPQSMAIFQYLEDRWPDPRLTPMDLRDRARMWAFCQAIACDIHPLNNLRVLQYLTAQFKATDADKDDWYRHWIMEGFRALEAMQRERPESDYCFGDAPTFADCCLVPQWYNGERYQCPLTPFSRLAAIVARCRQHEAFIDAHPDHQPDTPKA